MADLPNLFSDDMVRALLEGRKTQTRRVIAFPEASRVFEFSRVGYDERNRPLFEMKNRWGRHMYRSSYSRHFVHHLYWTRYGVGDRLWVRECVAAGACAPSKPSEWAASFWRREQGGFFNPNGLWYRADGLVPQTQITHRGPWKPNIFMPRWASRLTLIVTDVKVERVQDISEDDARAEGVEQWKGHDPAFPIYRDYLALPKSGPGCLDTAYRSFRTLWDNINGKREGCSWNDNPWVAAYTFTVHKQNIDTMKEAA